MNERNERSVTREAAHAAWFEVVKAHGLTSVEKISELNGHKTTLCFLKKDHKTVRGAGKGRTKTDNILSAYYEALEYYLSGINFNPYPVIVSSQNDIQKSASILPIRCCPDRFLAKSNRHRVLPWVIYSDIKNQEKYAVPLASVDLSYEFTGQKGDEINYANSAFYNASNGLASGSNFDDALIHSVLELIERDAYSYFLIDAFILRKDMLVINPESLPRELLKLVLKIEKDFSDKLLIIQLPSRFDVPVYCVTFMGCDFPNRPRGAGASLNPYVALERAIHESVQSYNLMHNDYLSKEMGRHPTFRRKLVKTAVHFPVNELIKNNQYSRIDFFEENKEQGDYLKILLNKIYKHSRVLFHIPYQDKKVVCVRSIIPDAEEFFLISHGFNMHPNETTQSYIKSQCGKEFTWNGMK